MTKDESFEISLHAFELMSVDERKQVLIEFGKLKFADVADRFFEAVHRVVKQLAETQA